MDKDFRDQLRVRIAGTEYKNLPGSVPVTYEEVVSILDALDEAEKEGDILHRIALFLSINSETPVDRLEAAIKDEIARSEQEKIAAWIVSTNAVKRAEEATAQLAAWQKAFDQVVRDKTQIVGERDAALSHADAMSKVIETSDCICLLTSPTAPCLRCRILALTPAASLAAHDSEVRRGVWGQAIRDLRASLSCPDVKPSELATVWERRAARGSDHVSVELDYLRARIPVDLAEYEKVCSELATMRLRFAQFVARAHDLDSTHDYALTACPHPECEEASKIIEAEGK